MYVQILGIYFRDSVGVLLGANLRAVGLCRRFSRDASVNSKVSTVKPLSGFEFQEVQCIKEISLDPRYARNEKLSMTMDGNGANFMSLDAFFTGYNPHCPRKGGNYFD